MTEKSIIVENLSKRFRIGLKDEVHENFVSAFASWVKSPFKNLQRLRSLNHFDESEEGEDVLWALKDINFEVNKGEVIGVIGKNGAGKSTLLKILSRITEPTEGRAVINGRVASLLEVGTGFHPELTGTENIYLNGTILGMSKYEVERKFDEIVEFSGVGKFINTPLKRYSSGMKVRLAFSVAAHLDPEIMLIDEVLAVGDLEFQKRCLGKMNDIAESGKTILFVSHNMPSIIQLCTKGILIEEGRLAMTGDTKSVVDRYSSKVYESCAVSLAEREDREGNRHIQFNDASVYCEGENGSKMVPMCGETLVIRANCQCNRPVSVEKVIFKMYVVNNRDDTLFLLDTESQNFFPANLDNQFNLVCRVPELPLPPGRYRLDFFMIVDSQRSDYIYNACQFEVTTGDYFGTGRIVGNKFPYMMLVKHDWEMEKRRRAQASSRRLS